VGFAGVYLTFGPLTPLSVLIPGFFVTMAKASRLPYGQTGAMRTVPEFAGNRGRRRRLKCHNFIAEVVRAARTALFADGTPVPLTVSDASAVVRLGCAGSVAYMLKRRAAKAPT